MQINLDDSTLKQAKSYSVVDSKVPDLGGCAICASDCSSCGKTAGMSAAEKANIQVKAASLKVLQSNAGTFLRDRPDLQSEITITGISSREVQRRDGLLARQSEKEDPKIAKSAIDNQGLKLTTETTPKITYADKDPSLTQVVAMQKAELQPVVVQNLEQAIQQVALDRLYPNKFQLSSEDLGPIKAFIVEVPVEHNKHSGQKAYFDRQAVDVKACSEIARDTNKAIEPETKRLSDKSSLVKIAREKKNLTKTGQNRVAQTSKRGRATRLSIGRSSRDGLRVVRGRLVRAVKLKPNILRARNSKITRVRSASLSKALRNNSLSARNSKKLFKAALSHNLILSAKNIKALTQALYRRSKIINQRLSQKLNKSQLSKGIKTSTENKYQQRKYLRMEISKIKHASKDKQLAIPSSIEKLRENIGKVMYNAGQETIATVAKNSQHAEPQIKYRAYNLNTTPRSESRVLSRQKSGTQLARSELALQSKSSLRSRAAIQAKTDGISRVRRELAQALLNLRTETRLKKKSRKNVDINKQIRDVKRNLSKINKISSSLLMLEQIKEQLMLEEMLGITGTHYEQLELQDKKRRIKESLLERAKES